MRIKKTTATALVIEVLTQRDDFMSRRMLEMALEGRASKPQIASALLWLRDKRAIDCIIEPDGVAWWFVLPPEFDQRSRKHEEIAIHERPGARRPRKRKFNDGRGDT